MGILLNPDYEYSGKDSVGGALTPTAGPRTLNPEYVYTNDTFNQQLSQPLAQKGQYASHEFVYNSYAGVDITAVIVLPGSSSPLVLGELQTISYSIHRENTPVRHIGHTNVSGFVKGPRTIAGSMIFTVFDSYAFYRIKEYRDLMRKGVFGLSDMLPPFDIVLTFANEYGMFSNMKIYGVTIVDEGGTMSVDDLITESTYTFMARGIQPINSYVPPEALQFMTGRTGVSQTVNTIQFG